MATWVMPPKKEAVSIINAGLDVFFITNGFDRLDSQRLQVCVEGVFIYCANNIVALNKQNEIEVKLFWEQDILRVFVQHCGPKGEWDTSLKNDSFPIRRTTFEAMGLFIAREMLHQLKYESLFDVVTGRVTNRYELVYCLGEETKLGQSVADMQKDANADALLDYLNSNV